MSNTTYETTSFHIPTPDLLSVVLYIRSYVASNVRSCVLFDFKNDVFFYVKFVKWGNMDYWLINACGLIGYTKIYARNDRFQKIDKSRSIDKTLHIKLHNPKSKNISLFWDTLYTTQHATPSTPALPWYSWLLCIVCSTSRRLSGAMRQCSFLSF